MLLTAHVLTGAVLGTVIDNPLILAPAGVASHLAMDIMPHYGPPPALHNGTLRDRLFIITGSLDFTASLIVVVAVCISRPDRIIPIIIGSVSAALPDLTYIPEVVFGQRLYDYVPWLKKLIYGFLAPIQWCERPWGLAVDAVWAFAMLVFLEFVPKYLLH